ncbi:MAG: putative ABC transporter permease, partial [Lachnospiraceae bacterium]|nr:putative ABC transporter permease [Lachnospiraceae bacterium]
FWYFIIYSLIGWMIEVVFHAVTQGKIVNRGFLNGPICPVYGSGVLMVLIVLLVAITRLLVNLHISDFLKCHVRCLLISSNPLSFVCIVAVLKVAGHSPRRKEPLFQDFS